MWQVETAGSGNSSGPPVVGSSHATRMRRQRPQGNLRSHFTCGLTGDATGYPFHTPHDTDKCPNNRSYGQRIDQRHQDPSLPVHNPRGQHALVFPTLLLRHGPHARDMGFLLGGEAMTSVRVCVCCVLAGQQQACAFGRGASLRRFTSVDLVRPMQGHWQPVACLKGAWAWSEGWGCAVGRAVRSSPRCSAAACGTAQHCSLVGVPLLFLLLRDNYYYRQATTPSPSRAVQSKA